MTAEYQVHGDVAVITLANPPVNGLGHATRKGITDGLARANADAAVKAIVVTGPAARSPAGRTSRNSARTRRCRSPTCTR